MSNTKFIYLIKQIFETACVITVEAIIDEENQTYTYGTLPGQDVCPFQLMDLSWNDPLCKGVYTDPVLANDAKDIAQSRMGEIHGVIARNDMGDPPLSVSENYRQMKSILTLAEIKRAEAELNLRAFIAQEVGPTIKHEGFDYVAAVNDRVDLSNSIRAYEVVVSGDPNDRTANTNLSVYNDSTDYLTLSRHGSDVDFRLNDLDRLIVSLIQIRSDIRERGFKDEY